MNSNFEYYKIFYYVAKYENLTKAATVLKTSQPAVTRTIHKLENELGCRLFTRSKTGMQLTPEGRTFYGYVAAGCAQFFKGENDLSNLISLENGTIYISATETALHCYLFQAMEEFNSLYPNVRFKILNNSTTESVNAVKEGKVDLAFVSANLQVAKPLRMKILRKYHDILMESVAETSEEFMDRYFEGDEFSVTEVSAALATNVQDASIVPVCMGSPINLRGVSNLLDDICGYFPSPDKRSCNGISQKTNEIFEANYDFAKANPPRYLRRSSIRSSENIL